MYQTITLNCEDILCFIDRDVGTYEFWPSVNRNEWNISKLSFDENKCNVYVKNDEDNLLLMAAEPNYNEKFIELFGFQENMHNFVPGKIIKIFKIDEKEQVLFDIKTIIENLDKEFPNSSDLQEKSKFIFNDLCFKSPECIKFYASKHIVSLLNMFNIEQIRNFYHNNNELITKYKVNLH